MPIYVNERATVNARAAREHRVRVVCASYLGAYIEY